MTALRSGRVSELLQTERAFPLLLALDEAHDLVVPEDVPGRRPHGGVRGGRDVDPGGLRLRAAEVAVKEQVVIVVVGVVVAEGDVDVGGYHGPLAGGGDLLLLLEGGADVQVALDGELDDEEDAEDLASFWCERMMSGAVAKGNGEEREIEEVVAGVDKVSVSVVDMVNGCRALECARYMRGPVL
ncbi:unnamed protein product [Clonostachys rosea f. rosea IK726]|uniref:Uncharacterized protein n=1 Tax=Clonostachys rosea f. rosea IK726 TaxID=1349383 RepID=A0ACA9TBJ8_BIOOC|nr:unnamed protein product [Clonostachys rosea f. rosea IK726]